MSLVWIYTSPASLLPVFWINNTPFSVNRGRTQFKISGNGAYLLLKNGFVAVFDGFLILLCIYNNAAAIFLISIKSLLFRHLIIVLKFNKIIKILM